MGTEMQFHATTICCVHKDGKTAIAGDGQVTFGQAAIMKANAKKVRKLYHGRYWPGLPAPWRMPSPSLRNSRGN